MAINVFMFFEAFRLTLVKKKRQNEESRENVALYKELVSRGWFKDWTNQSAANKACCRSVECCDWLKIRGPIRAWQTSEQLVSCKQTLFAGKEWG